MSDQMYICPSCREVVDPEDLIEEDVGGYEECRGSRVWKSCIVTTTPCCGVEPVEGEEWGGEEEDE